MTASIYLVTKSNPQLGRQLINGVTMCIVNSVSLADAKLNAALACNAGLVPTEGQSEAENSVALDVYGPTYFDTAVAISSSGGVPGSGNLFVDGDALVFQMGADPQFVAGTSYTPVG